MATTWTVCGSSSRSRAAGSTCSSATLSWSHSLTTWSSKMTGWQRPPPLGHSPVKTSHLRLPVMDTSWGWSFSRTTPILERDLTSRIQVKYSFLLDYHYCITRCKWTHEVNEEWSFMLLTKRPLNYVLLLLIPLNIQKKTYDKWKHDQVSFPPNTSV